MKDKSVLKFHRAFWILAFAVTLALMFGLISVKPFLNSSDSANTVISYDSVSNESSCEINLYFNMKVDTGSAKIEFSDIHGNILETRTVDFSQENSDRITKTITVNGEVSNIKVVSYDFVSKVFGVYIPVVCGFCLILELFMFISALFLSYKEYNYNGKIISAYAGFYHHYLRVDGNLVDEHRTLFTSAPIILSASLEDSTIIQASISSMNRITMKVNNQLVK